MGVFSKKVTVYGSGSQELIPKASVPSKKELTKQAVKSYVFNKSTIPLHEYLLNAGGGTGTVNAWEKAYAYAKSSKYDMVGLPEYGFTGRGGEVLKSNFYPMIPLKPWGWDYLIDQHDNPNYFPKLKEQVLGIFKTLGMDAIAFRKQLAEGMEGNWHKIKHLTFHAAVGLHAHGTIELKGDYGTVAYVYKSLIGNNIASSGIRTGFDYNWDNIDWSFENYLARDTHRLYHIKDKVTTFASAVKMSRGSGTQLLWIYKAIIDGVEYTLTSDKTPRDMDNKSKEEQEKIIYEWHQNKYKTLPEIVKKMPLGSYLVLHEEGGEVVRYYYRNSELNNYIDFHTATIYLSDKEWGWAGQWKEYAQNASWVIPNTWHQQHGLNKNHDTDYPLFPISRELLKTFSPLEQERILQESLRVSWFFTDTTKVPRGWVNSLIKYGGILLKVYTINAAGFTGITATELATKAATVIASKWAIRQITRLAIKLGIISPELAGAIEVVFTAAVSVGISVGFDFTKVFTAPNMMRLVNSSFDAYNKYQTVQIRKIQQTINNEYTKYNDNMARLKAKQELLETGVAKDAHLYLDAPSFAPRVNLFESPEMMYARHYSFNVIPMSHGLISNLTDGLYIQRPIITDPKDIVQEIEDVLLID